MDCEPSETWENYNSSQQSGDPSNYSTKQHIGQNSGHLRNHGIRATIKELQKRSKHLTVK